MGKKQTVGNAALEGIYKDGGFESKGVSYDKFVETMESNPEARKGVYNDLGFESKGVSYDKYESVILKKKEVTEPVSQPSSGSGQTVSTVDPTDVEIKRLQKIALTGGEQEKMFATKQIEKLESKRKEALSRQQYDTAVSKVSPTPKVQGDITGVYTQEEVQTGQVPQVDNLEVAQEEVEKSNLSPTLDRFQPNRVREYDIEEISNAAQNVENEKGRFARNTPEGIRAEQMIEALEQDYLDYLLQVNPEKHNYKKNEITAIKNKQAEGKELSTAEQKTLRDFANEAFSTLAQYEKKALYDVRSKADVDTYFKQSQSIYNELDKIKLEYDNLVENGNSSPNTQAKANELIARQDQLLGRLDQLKQNTGFTDEVQEQYSQTVGQLGKLQRSTFSEMNTGRFSELQNVEDKDRAEKAEKFREAEAGGGKKEAFADAFTSAVARGVVSGLQVPKVLGDAIGDNDYDWADELYNNAESVLMGMDVDLGRAQMQGKNYKDLPTLYRLTNLAGDAIGSATLFAAGGATAGGTTAIGRAVATAGTSFLAMEGDSYKEALSLGMNPKEAAKAATAISVAVSSIEALVPDVKYFEPSAARKSILNALVSGKSFKEAVEGAVSAIPVSVWEKAKSGIKEAGEEVLSEVGSDVSKAAINEIKSMGEDYELFSKDAYVDAILGGFIGGSGMSVFSRPQMERRSPLQEEVLLSAVERKDGLIEDALVGGEEKSAEVGMLLEGVAETYDALKENPQFQKLDRSKQSHILSELQRKELLKSNEAKIGVKTDAVQLEIEKIDSEVKNLLETGKTATERSLDLNKAKAEKEVVSEPIELEVGEQVLKEKEEAVNPVLEAVEATEPSIEDDIKSIQTPVEIEEETLSDSEDNKKLFKKLSLLNSLGKKGRKTKDGNALIGEVNELAAKEGYEIVVRKDGKRSLIKDGKLVRKTPVKRTKEQIEQNKAIAAENKKANEKYNKARALTIEEVNDAFSIAIIGLNNLITNDAKNKIKRSSIKKALFRGQAEIDQRAFMLNEEGVELSTFAHRLWEDVKDKGIELDEITEAIYTAISSYDSVGKLRAALLDVYEKQTEEGREMSENRMYEKQAIEEAEKELYEAGIFGLYDSLPSNTKDAVIEFGTSVLDENGFIDIEELKAAAVKKIRDQEWLESMDLPTIEEEIAALEASILEDEQQLKKDTNEKQDNERGQESAINNEARDIARAKKEKRSAQIDSEIELLSSKKDALQKKKNKIISDFDKAAQKEMGDIFNEGKIGGGGMFEEGIDNSKTNIQKAIKEYSDQIELIDRDIKALIKEKNNLSDTPEADLFSPPMPEAESTAKKAANSLRNLANDIRNKTKGSAFSTPISPEVIAKTLDVLATLLDKYDDVSKALKEWRKSKEYTELSDVTEVESMAKSGLNEAYEEPEKTEKTNISDTLPVDIFEAIDKAKRSKKTQVGKVSAANEAVKNMGKKGQNALYIDTNFETIVKSLKDKTDSNGNTILKVEC